MTASPTDGATKLRVLVANEHRDRLNEVSRAIIATGHVVVVETVDVDTVGSRARVEHPDIALVAVGRDPEHALEQIASIADEVTCPVIAVLDEPDPDFVRAAAERGIFGYASHRDLDDLQSSIEVALRRFTELRDLEDAFQRRTIVERAKGILMERQGIDEHEAFILLRNQARQTGVRIVEVAKAILASHRLLHQRPGR